MSLEQAHAFYQALCQDTTLYSQYLSHCSFQGSSPANVQTSPVNSDRRHPDHPSDRQWDEQEILTFAQNKGYCFGLGDLYQVWFGQHDYRRTQVLPSQSRWTAIAQLNHQLLS